MPCMAQGVNKGHSMLSFALSACQLASMLSLTLLACQLACMLSFAFPARQVVSMRSFVLPGRQHAFLTCISLLPCLAALHAFLI